MSTRSAAELGFGAVPCPADQLQPRNPSSPPAVSLSELPLPDTKLVAASKAHLESILPLPVYNHSHRAYLFAAAMAKAQFPDWTYDPEGLYLACLWHDFGCVPENIRATRMSFELYGAIRSREFLNEQLAPRDLADGVAETINRHTDFVAGEATTHVQLIQLGTLFDNHGLHTEWLAKSTIDEIIEAYPRLGWNEGFAAAMEDEVAQKPWSHTTCLKPGIWDDSRGNKFMAQYE